MDDFQVRGLPRASCVASYHVGVDGRILLQLAQARAYEKYVPLDFPCAKIALLLSITYFVSLDLSYWNATGYSALSQYAQLASSFLICLFGMRWILLDQRERCPVCLRRVTHPAQVGQASRTFLAWNGTELMCTSGHTLLHVPGLPTSWFGTQRWMYLDTSWKFLFAGTGVG